MAQDDVTQRIQNVVANNKVMIFMKGTANFPQCGFSAATVGIFQELGVPFETADVLSDPDLRDGIKRYSNWPTIPQVFIGGKFVGSCDIVREMYESGDLQTLLQSVMKD
jgi:monothiol glutaredoxin